VRWWLYVTSSVISSNWAKSSKMIFSDYPLGSFVLLHMSQVWPLSDNRFADESPFRNTVSRWSLYWWSWDNGHYWFSAKPLKRLNWVLFCFERSDYSEWHSADCSAIALSIRNTPACAATLCSFKIVGRAPGGLEKPRVYEFIQTNREAGLWQVKPFISPDCNSPKW